jgi:nicotinate-nucleotide--dimethylbenzimidazole phosphoribosyltransferase
MLEQFEIPAVDPGFVATVQRELDQKTKPAGSLGRIEALALQIACAQQSLVPVADPARLLLFAGDHGMVAEGVSAWPSEVTAQMVANFLAGGAAANVFARANAIAITIADAGVAAPLADHADLVRANIARGTRNAMHEDAMTADQLQSALLFGATLAQNAVKAGDRALLLGEMGIGNTAASALLAHAIDGIELAALAGPGAGLDAAGVRRKADILARIASRRPGKLTPIDALCAFGGYEIAAMAGALIGAASLRAIVVVDGFIATAAALCALRARPQALPYVVFAHRSREPGHRLMLQALGVEPLFDLDLRLGEGTGALLAFPLLRAACAMLREMATFTSAGISGKQDAGS